MTVFNKYIYIWMNNRQHLWIMGVGRATDSVCDNYKLFEGLDSVCGLFEGSYRLLSLLVFRPWPTGARVSAYECYSPIAF